jgi:hypothetical protein
MPVPSVTRASALPQQVKKWHLLAIVGTLAAFFLFLGTTERSSSLSFLA